MREEASVRLVGLPLSISALLFTALALPAHAATIVVDVGGSSAYATIQAGIDASTSGDTVLVMPGTYAGTGNRDIYFNGREITLLAEDGPQQTLIASNRYARGFILYQGEGNSAVIDGFTIRDAGLWTSQGNNGGGIYCRNSAPTVRNCVFDDCFAFGGSQMMYGAGGGIYCEASDGMLVEDCVFASCRGLGGGGVYASGGEITLTRCRFEDCSGYYTAGGVSLGPGCLSPISECTFVGCTSSRSAGALSVYQSMAVIERCTFVGNIGAQGVVHFGQTSSTLQDCIIAFNDAAAVRCQTGANPEITHCVIFGNAGGDSLCGIHTDNLFVDPAFCDLAGGDLTLCADSPCLPSNNPWGESIGALGEGCLGCSSPVEPRSWGRIKALYR